MIILKLTKCVYSEVAGLAGSEPNEPDPTLCTLSNCIIPKAILTIFYTRHFEIKIDSFP